MANTVSIPLFVAYLDESSAPELVLSELVLSELASWEESRSLVPLPVSELVFCSDAVEEVLTLDEPIWLEEAPSSPRHAVKASIIAMASTNKTTFFKLACSFLSVLNQKSRKQGKYPAKNSLSEMRQNIRSIFSHSNRLQKETETGFAFSKNHRKYVFSREKSCFLKFIIYALHFSSNRTNVSLVEKARL